MKSRFHGLFSSLIGMAAAGLLASNAAQAGQFKTLNTQSLAVGASVIAHSSPKNSGSAIEMEIFEWPSASTGGKYRCNILSNSTGTTLTIRLIGVTATPLGSCSALPGGSCSTPIIGLLGDFKFLCIVATSNNGLAGVNAHYVMSVSRH
jgi:hypothetical protein